MLKKILKQSKKSLRFKFSSNTKPLDLPIIDLSSFLPNSDPDLAEAEKLVKSLKKYSAVAIKDPRALEQNNLDFLSLMEKYFEDRATKYYKGEALPECFPEHGYQVGITPEYAEAAKNEEKITKEKFQSDPVGIFFNFEKACFSTAS